MLIDMKNSGFVHIGFLNGLEMLKLKHEIIYYWHEYKYRAVLS
jgi:hypothetical protein